MTARRHQWRIDESLATDFAHWLGWHPSAPIAQEMVGPLTVDLVERLGAKVPAGTTAKLAAMANGEVPPGADPAAVMARILGDAERGTVTASLSCWPFTTMLAALVTTLTEVPVSLAVNRNRSQGAVPVDFHAAVVVGVGAHSWIADPYFAVALPGPGHPDVEHLMSGIHALRTDPDEPTGHWSYRLVAGQWGVPLRFVSFAENVNASDVEVMCRLSKTHSGAPTLRYARLVIGSTAAVAFESVDGSAVVSIRRSVSASDRLYTDRNDEPFASWDAAHAAFTAWVRYPV